MKKINQNENSNNDLWKISVLLLFFVALTILNTFGISSSNSVPNSFLDTGLIFEIFTSTIKIFIGEFRVSYYQMMIMNADYYYFIILLWIVQFSTFAFTLYNLVSVFTKVSINHVLLYFYKKSKNIIYLFGESPEIAMFLKSMEDIQNTPKVIVVMNENEQNVIFPVTKIKYAYILIKHDASFLKGIVNKNENMEQKIISLYSDDEINTKLLIEYSKVLMANPNITITAYLAYEDMEKPDFYNLYSHLEKKVEFYSYHRILANKFVYNHPLFEVHKNKIIKKVEYVLIGFGQTNRQILKHLIVNNQMSFDAIKYKIYSNDIHKTKGHFLHPVNAIRYKFEDKTEFFELPKIIEDINQINYELCDVTSIDFLTSLDNHEFCNDKSTQFIVSIGDDVQNIEVAHSLSKYLHQNNANKNSKIFVHTMDSTLNINQVFQDSFIESFGNKIDILTYSNVVDEKMNTLSKIVHETTMNTSWNELGFYEKDSSHYKALSIRTQLNLLGLDFCSLPGISEEEYLKIYDNKNHLPLWQKNEVIYDTKRYFTISNRNLLAQLEHSRWNAYMILNGWVPMKKSQLFHNIKNHKGKSSFTKSILAKQHICITSFKGLDNLNTTLKREYSKYNIKVNTDFMIYDYSVMDSLYRILKEMNIGIKKIG